LRNAKFSKKADVYAAGIIFLELIALQSPSSLYKFLWPKLLQLSIPSALKEVLKMSLAAAPEARTGSFDEMLTILRSEGGVTIGELSKDAELSFDISSGIEQCMPSVLATEESRSVRQ
jgi:hypothetical protein